MEVRADEIAQSRPPSDRAGFLRRLGIYCTGIAIGFLILGMFRTRSAAEARRRQAIQAAAEAEPPYSPVRRSFPPQSTAADHSTQAPRPASESSDAQPGPEPEKSVPPR